MGDTAPVKAIDRTVRNFSKTLIGDFTLDRELAQHRGQLFLPRNMSRVMAQHLKNHELYEKTRRASPRHAASLRNQQKTAEKTARTTTAANGEVNGTTPGTNVNAASTSNSHAQTVTVEIEKPALESMSPACLAVKVKNNEYTPPARRSIRRAQDQPYQHQDAELRITLRNVRKKLNFKNNLLAEYDRPSKRQKVEPIRCQCHLTVWDNRDGLSEAEPIIRKSEIGHVTKVLTSPSGDVVDVDLEEPFYIRASELKVSVKGKAETSLAIVDKYFLEIKIIPTKSTPDWPPISLLGKSDGDHFPGLGKTASENLQGALVARYMHLPQAPMGDVPLSIFFLRESKTFRTKYGLEVDSEWSLQPTPRKRVKKEPELEPETQPWAFDDKNKLFGRSPPVPAKPTPAVVLEKPAPEPEVHLTARVLYSFEDTNSNGVPKEFRKATVQGFFCPICSGQPHKSLQLLEFHLTHTHHKYKFVIDDEKYDRATSKLNSVLIKVRPMEPSKPKPPEKLKSEKEMDWQAPSVPLDLPAYLNGDLTWLGANKKKGTQSTNPTQVMRDENAVLRKQHGGFLKVDAVPNFRKADRKRYPIIKLRTQTEDKQTMYTSISHRPLALSEEPLSESDDEAGDEWIIERHMENLDLNSAKENWSKWKRELFKRWDRHRLEEQLEHSRFLSDSLVRFVRKHQIWLQTNGPELVTCFYEFLNQLKRLRVIDDEVVIGLHGLIFTKSTAKPPTNSSTLTLSKPPLTLIDTLKRPHPSQPMPQFSQFSPQQLAQQLEMFKRRNEILLSLPPGTCGWCISTINNPILESIHCSSPTCAIPGVPYHYICAKAKREDRFSETFNCFMCEAMARFRGQYSAATSKTQLALSRVAGGPNTTNGLFGSNVHNNMNGGSGGGGGSINNALMGRTSNGFMLGVNRSGLTTQTAARPYPMGVHSIYQPVQNSNQSKTNTNSNGNGINNNTATGNGVSHAHPNVNRVGGYNSLGSSSSSGTGGYRSAMGDDRIGRGRGF